jgi:uridine phosphorylase
MSYPILEHDESREALLEPSRLVGRADVPEHCVACFFGEVIDSLVRGGAKAAANRKSEMGDHPIYEIEFQGQRLGVTHPGLGGPLAAGMLEEAIAMGCSKFIVCGSAGVLQRNIAMGHLIVPTSAVRDEGTSYHYLPPSREVEARADVVAAICRVLDAEGVQYARAKTWTTDAFYRETPGKIARRRAEGCVTVEMEAASLFAVARFRDVALGQILYCGDDCSGETWDSRHYTSRLDIRRRLFELAAKACLAL